MRSFLIAKPTAFQWRKSPFFSGGNQYKITAEITAPPGDTVFTLMAHPSSIYEHVYSHNAAQKKKKTAQKGEFPLVLSLRQCSLSQV